MKKSASNRKSSIFLVRLTPQERSDVEQAAAALNQTDSEFARKALADAVRRARKRVLER